MNASEKRMAVHDRYKGILGRNKYSQSLRTYVNTKYKDGKYYSDCSSSVSWAYKAAGYPISYGGTTLPSTVGLYNSKDLVDVPVAISKGQITNPEVLRVGDLLLFAGTDSSRKGSGYVGHVEMVASISGSRITIYGHGSGTPRETEMTAYLRKRYNSKTGTALGNKGLIRVRRRIADDGSEPKQPKLGDRELREGMTGADVRELQSALIAQGYSCGPDGADADFGPNTAKAVRAFQADNGLAQTGIADDATIAALTGSTGSTPAPATPTVPRVVISDCKECNIRTGPGTQYESVGRAHPGDTFAVVENPDNWVPVLIDGQIRWVSGKYAKVEE